MSNFRLTVIENEPL